MLPPCVLGRVGERSEGLECIEGELERPNQRNQANMSLGHLLFFLVVEVSLARPANVRNALKEHTGTLWSVAGDVESWCGCVN